MNWGVLMYGAVIILSTVYYIFVGKHHYSPPQEHITGTEWYTDYQPVSYNLTSKRGDRTQFQKHVLVLFPHPYD